MVEKARTAATREPEAISALANQFDAGIESVITLLLNCEGHVLVTGAGTSQAIAQRFAHLLSCCGTPALCIDAADCMHGGSGAVKAGDVVYIISKGWQSREINKFAEIARELRAKIIAQTESPESPIGQISDAIYKVRATEDVDPYGMIATGSSLVNAATGDALCAILLDLKEYSQDDLGRTYPEGAVGKKLDERGWE